MASHSMRQYGAYGVLFLALISLVKANCPYMDGTSSLTAGGLTRVNEEAKNILEDVKRHTDSGKLDPDTVKSFVDRTMIIYKKVLTPTSPGYLRVEVLALLRFVGALEAYLEEDIHRAMQLLEFAIIEALTVPEINPHEKDPNELCSFIIPYSNRMFLKLSRECECSKEVADEMMSFYSSFPRQKVRAIALGRALGLTQEERMASDEELIKMDVDPEEPHTLSSKQIKEGYERIFDDKEIDLKMKELNEFATTRVLEQEREEKLVAKAVYDYLVKERGEEELEKELRDYQAEIMRELINTEQEDDSPERAMYQ